MCQTNLRSLLPFNTTDMTKLALMRCPNLENWLLPFVRRIEFELSLQGPAMNFELVDEAKEADLVLYVDSNKIKHNLSGYRKLLQWADKEGKYVFALSFEDKPLGALPGIYTSLVPRNFDPALHLSWPHLEAPNKYVESAPLTSPKQASKLFSFLGSCSHPLRRKLFSMYESKQCDKWQVGEIKRWYDHTEDEHKNYVAGILDSRFALCPRGISGYSHRIFESIMLERVPVIIADNWVPFSFPEQDYYITIAEKELGAVTSHLERELANYDYYLTNLRAVKSKWLTANMRYGKVVEQFLKFHRQHQSAHQPRALLERLESSEYRENNGLLFHQRVLSLVNSIPRRGKKTIAKFASEYAKLF